MTTTAKQVALLLPRRSPLLRAEQEELRAVVHATLAKRFGLPMFSLARTRELERTHARGLEPTAPGACVGPSLKTTFARAAPGVGFAPLHVQCVRGACSLELTLDDRRPKNARWPTSFATEMQPAEVGLPTFARLAAALRPRQASSYGILGSRPATSRLRLELSAGHFGAWDERAVQTLERVEAVLARCAQPGKSLRTWAVLDLAADGAVAALERAEERALSASEDKAWQCVTRALTALRFATSQERRRALLWIAPPLQDNPYRDGKYGGLDELTRTRVRLPPVEEVFEMPADPAPTDELQSAFAACYREAFGAAETRVAAIRSKVTVPVQGNARYTFEVRSVPEPKAAAALIECLETRTHELSWRCAEREDEIRLEGLTCVFGESS